MEGAFGENKYPHYYPIYDQYFSRFYGTPCTVLEIGVDKGGSLKLWDNLFGAHAIVAGIDSNPECIGFGRGFHVFIGNQADEKFLSYVWDTLGCIDVVIDDGSHVDSDIRASFDFFYPRLSEDGVYLIEDIHDHREYRFSDWAKERVNDLSARYHSGDQTFAETTKAIHFHNSVIVFERGRA